MSEWKQIGADEWEITFGDAILSVSGLGGYETALFVPRSPYLRRQVYTSKLEATNSVEAKKEAVIKAYQLAASGKLLAMLIGVDVSKLAEACQVDFDQARGDSKTSVTVMDGNGTVVASGILPSGSDVDEFAEISDYESALAAHNARREVRRRAWPDGMVLATPTLARHKHGELYCANLDTMIPDCSMVNITIADCAATDWEIIVKAPK